MARKFMVTPLGVRGTFPITFPNRMKYGGNTTCFKVEIGDKLIIFDCGSGLINLESDFENGKYTCGDIFLSHVHFDHIQGIPFFLPFFSAKYKFRILGEKRYRMGIDEQIKSFMRRPFFPISIDKFVGQIEYIDIGKNGKIDCGDGIIVESLRSNHPDTTTSYKVICDNKVLCYCLDYEHKDGLDIDIENFVSDADLLIYDNHYIDEEYEQKRGWGHSTWQQGVNLAQKCRVKNLLLAHHNPGRTDDEIDEIEYEARKIFKNSYAAKEGESLLL